VVDTIRDPLEGGIREALDRLLKKKK